jgi:predicted ATPase
MPDDPLKNLPQQEQLLFEEFTRASDGKSFDAVLGASMNVIVNVLRQIFATRKLAEMKYDELFGRGKTLLLDKHYDSVTGHRRNVFPHDQIVKMPLHIEPL